MSDIMRPMSIGHLMNWALSEYKKKGSIFGIDKLVHYTSGQALPIYEEKIESPFGPAAGPNTQLAQNIIASYVAGSRFFELKTVQVMDGAELSACVAKPCITAGDECYNCEWSTELYVSQAYAEYVKAWVVCKILAKELGLGNPDGFVFNMSVGYDLEGIKSEKVNTFIDDMIEAKDTEVFKECINWALENVDSFENVDADYIKSISSNISSSITESTLHGCPPDEIERIATYLITEKHLHTFIKCNPTLFAIIVLFQINLSNNTCANIPNTVCPLYINHRIFIFCKNLFMQILIHRSLNIFKLLLMIFLFQIYFRQNHIESRGTITGKFLYLFPIFRLTGKLVTGNNRPLLHIYFFSRQ